MSNANIVLVQRLYDAFSRGEIANIIETCAPDVVWRLVGCRHDYPTFGDWRGPESVEVFFRLVAELEDFQEFSPNEFHAFQDRVFVLGYTALTIKGSGCSMGTEWCHVHTIRDGKIVAFQEFSDTAQRVSAFRAECQRRS